VSENAPELKLQDDIVHGRTFLKWVFWIWGIGGLLICSLNYLSLSGSVGVGTSTYMALGFLYWLCGMVLFGIGALLAEKPIKPRKPRERAPLAPPDQLSPLTAEYLRRSEEIDTVALAPPDQPRPLTAEGRAAIWRPIGSRKQ
jgi:hypothetical protein